MHDHLILAVFAALGLIALCLGYVIREARRAEQGEPVRVIGTPRVHTPDTDADR